jgi:hypothetical protein
VHEDGNEINAETGAWLRLTARCCLAGFQGRSDDDVAGSADLEIGDTAALESCATGAVCSTENVEEPTPAT